MGEGFGIKTMGADDAALELAAGNIANAVKSALMDNPAGAVTFTGSGGPEALVLAIRLLVDEGHAIGVFNGQGYAARTREALIEGSPDGMRIVE